MTTPALIMWATVLAVGVPSAWRNPTAFALVSAWLAGEAIFLITGDNLPTEYALFPDIFVLAVIFAKHEHACIHPYRNMWHQLKCCLFERSPCDRVIVIIFLIEWVLYVADISAFYKWYLLWGLTIAQFLAAGVESFNIFRRAYTAASDTSETTSGDECRVAWSRGYG